MPRRTLTIAARTAVVLICLMAADLATTKRVAHSQYACPSDFWVYNCVPMPPSEYSTINNNFQSTYASHYNSAYTGCQVLYTNFVFAYSNNRTWFNQDLSPYGETGEYGPSAPGNILIGGNAGTGLTLMKTVIHESAHDMGCSDEGFDSAYAWEDFCVPVDPSNLPPPPMDCPGFGW